MGHAAPLVTILGAEAADARPRRPGSERAGGDPIARVDAAVRSVLAAMRGAPLLPRDAAGHVCTDRLFSLRHAEALPPGTRLLRIGPGTVVTPLARDLLRRQGIAIVLGIPEAWRKSAAGEWA